jgi:hypothetical protein
VNSVNSVFVNDGSVCPDEYADSQTINVNLGRYGGEICGSCGQPVEWHSWIFFPDSAGRGWGSATDCSESAR